MEQADGKVKRREPRPFRRCEAETRAQNGTNILMVSSGHYCSI
jgi:hypothetical protein